MKLYIRNKLISLGGSSEILNENQEVIYTVKCKVVSPTKKKFIYNKNGDLLYIVRNKYWHFWAKSCFIYDGEKNKIAKIRKKVFSIGGKYFLEDYKDEIRIEGKWASWTLDIIKNDKIIGTVRREFNLFKDCFVLDAESNDIEFLMALVIAIDNIGDAQHDDHD